MTKEEEKDKLNDDNSANTDTQKNNISFFNRLKQQVKTLNFKNEKQEIADENITQVDNEIVLEEELKRKEKEAKERAFRLESARKKFEKEQKRIEEEHKKNMAQRAEQERLEAERIAREKELERQRIEEEKARKREEERLERERIAHEKELERQRIEEEKARKREEERLERERIAREKELERQRIEEEKARKREEERLERERIEKEQAEERRKLFQKKDKEFKLAEDLKKIEFLEKENEKKEHENNLLALETSLIALEDKIGEKALSINKLKNRKAEKDEILLEEKRLSTLLTQKQILQKDIAAEKKLIERIQKNLELEHKIDGFKKEIYSIRKEVVNEDETVFKVKNHKNKLENIFIAAFVGIKAFTLKYIFRKDVKDYNGIRKTSKNIKVKIATSFILAILLSLCFLIMLKFISSAKEHYVSFDDLQTTAVDTTDEMKKQKEAEEKAKILEAQEKANAARIDSEAQDEEITAKLAGTFVSYSFDVKREITVNKKLHTFKSANWADTGDVIEAGTKFTVDKLVSPAGYMMYRISSGDHAGQFVTANEKFVSVDKKNDNFSNFVSRQVAIKFLASQNVYKDQEINDVRVTMSNGAVLNISGYGISKNNRLIYHITDGSFIPVNPVRLTEVNRESANSKNINKEDKNSSNSQRNSTTQNTTQRNR
ncbi:transporter [Gemella morbillorum]|uniref:transporter n=2 Tax=Gemella morbillorum TaxID=29391 RepID=UPI0025517491|nr:transporter [Gemella morbillorum]MDK8254484.1 transporter [Gemella morbillorum]